MNAIVTDAQRLVQTGQFADAAARLKDYCEGYPGDADAWRLRALALIRLADASGAVAAVEQAVKLRPQDPALRLFAANILQDALQPEAALAYARSVSAADSVYPQACNQAGLLLADLQRFAEAEAAFREAVRVDPGYARAQGNLAASLLKRNKPAEALAAASEAIRLQPENAHARYAAAAAMLMLGRTGEAIESLQQAVRLQPAFADALFLLATTYRQVQNIEGALAVTQQLLAAAPGRMDALKLMGDLQAARGDLSGSRATYATVLAKQPNDLEAALRHALTLPVAYTGPAEIDAARRAVEQGLDHLVAQTSRFRTLPRDVLLQQVQYSNFYLAYQGRDDRPFQCRYGDFLKDLLSAAMPELFEPLPLVAARNRRVRVGFVSRFFYDSTAGNYFESWITGLDRGQFEVFVFPVHAVQDQLTERIRHRADLFAPFEPDFAALALQIRRCNLDVLVYPELGMDGKTFALAACRLAPVQVAGWGHPVTTGHANMDYFVSCQEMEPANAATHYRESLVLLPGLGTRYALPRLPDELRARTRADYQLPENRNLYLVPQSLFKIHPDNDAMLVEILQRDPDGTLVMFAGQAQAALNIFIARLQRKFGEAGLSPQGRVKILPDVGRADYQRINQLCDLMLDTVHWSGGNTSLDALAVGLPIVTLPGEFMRGRQSMAMLRMMQCEELIVPSREAFVETACRLGRDAAARSRLSARILDARTMIFDDDRPLAALAGFLLRVTKGAAPDGP